MRRRLLPATLATIVLAVGAWVALAPSATAASSVTIGLRSFAISKSVASVPHGMVTFHIRTTPPSHTTSGSGSGPPARCLRSR